jgi:hypothetical protein
MRNVFNADKIKWFTKEIDESQALWSVIPNYYLERLIQGLGDLLLRTRQF